ncbi:AfsR/SARP family transcriptional regulator [Streptomyces lushanensis]|uniref:AfsR/SARP family transcriptional regulator n=1 Tax=Streptomyces lushanensis TaxID=1434255 RepID=UPI001FE1B8B2|nr:BTAD domain-containing putative transcriptional regulator [Streptomyces lushanensis]
MLGSIDVRLDGRPVELGHARQRCVLAALMVDVNRVVSVDQLIDRVWGERSPQRAQASLYSYISRLRQALSPAADADIERRPGGYVLNADTSAVDLHRFRELVERARTVDDGEAEALFEEALALWHGDAATDQDTPWFNSLREALLRERHAAELDLVDIRLRSGRHTGLPAELTTRVEAHPLDERLVGQLMLALYRDGRPADALARYEELRERLATELGTDPGPPLRELRQRILTADPALDEPAPATTHGFPGSSVESAPPPAPVPRQLPAPPPMFTGRNSELARLGKLLEPGAERGGTVVISAIGGTGGIGKTWLALRWAHSCQERFPDGQLYADLRGFSPSGDPVPAAVAVRAFLEALGAPPGTIPADPDAQAALYRSLTAGKRLLILLDNARSTTQVLPLLPGSPTCTVLVTSRHQLTGLTAAHGGAPLTLDVLTDTEALELLTRHLGTARIAAEPDAAATLLKHCAGLPLAISILAARATMNPALSLAALASELHEAATRLDALDAGETATDLRAVFASSYEALDAPTARVFRLLGLAPGADIGLPAAASLTGLPPSRLRAHLRTLHAAHLVQEHMPHRYTCHDLLRAYATELAQSFDTEAERTAALDRLLDHYVHTAYAADRLLLPHRDPLTLPAPAEGLTPEQLVGHEEAMEWFSREHTVLTAAVEHAARLGLDTRVWQLAWATVTFQSRRGHWHEVESVQRAALAAAVRLGDRSAQAECRRGLAWALAQTARTGEARNELELALALSGDLGDDTGRAHAHLTLSWLDELEGDARAAFEHDLTALGLFTSSGHRSGRARALNALGWDRIQHGDHQQAVLDCEEALALQQELDDERGQAGTWDTLGYAYQRIGDYGRAKECFQHSLRLNRALGHRFNEAETLIHLGETHRETGALPAAREAMQQALTILIGIGHPQTELNRVRAMLQELNTPTA